MDYDRIKSLLNKYYAGETSLSEEREVSKYFKQNIVNSEFIIEKQLFENFEKESKASSVPKSLNDDLLDMIEVKSKYTLILKFNNPAKWTIGIAASLLLFISVTILYNPASNGIEDTFANEEQAYIATKDVLCYVSSVMEKEMRTISRISHVNNGLESIKKLQKFDHTIQKFKTEKK